MTTKYKYIKLFTWNYKYIITTRVDSCTPILSTYSPLPSVFFVILHTPLTSMIHHCCKSWSNKIKIKLFFTDLNFVQDMSLKSHELLYFFKLLQSSLGHYFLLLFVIFICMFCSYSMHTCINFHYSSNKNTAL